MPNSSAGGCCLITPRRVRDGPTDVEDVVVGAESVESGVGVGKGSTDEQQQGSTDPDDSLGLASSAGDASVVDAEEGVVPATASPRTRARYRLPCPVEPLPLVLPAEELMPGPGSSAASTP